MATITPSPSTWTLRLKHRNQTVLLHINPLQTFASIKQTLFEVLKDVHLYADNLPASPSDIQLAKPVYGEESNEPEAWELGPWERPSSDIVVDSEDVDGGGGPSGKGKPKGRKSDGRKSGGSSLAGNDGVELAGEDDLAQCPKGAGLKDNAMLAYRWDGDDWEVEFPKYDDWALDPTKLNGEEMDVDDDLPQ